MLGAIIGDIVGSIYEFNNIKTSDFEFLNEKCFFTDDTVMSCAIARALLDSEGKPELLQTYAKVWQRIYGKDYPGAGYGGRFLVWLNEEFPEPYGSWGNGAAMKISPVGWVANSEEEVEQLSGDITSLTHNHPEGRKGAEATAMCVYLARTGKTKQEIKEYVNARYYDLGLFTSVDELREKYSWHSGCKNCVPQAIYCFLESENFEDCIRKVISIGGDSDTLAAIAGGIAEAFYGIPLEIYTKARTFLTNDLLKDVDEFEAKYGKKVI